LMVMNTPPPPPPPPYSVRVCRVQSGSSSPEHCPAHFADLYQVESAPVGGGGGGGGVFITITVTELGMLNRIYMKPMLSKGERERGGGGRLAGTCLEQESVLVCGGIK